MLNAIIVLVVALVGTVSAFFFQRNKTQDVEAENDNLKTNDDVAQFTQQIVDNEKAIKGDEVNEEAIQQSIKKIEVLKDSVGSLVDFFNKRK